MGDDDGATSAGMCKNESKVGTGLLVEDDFEISISRLMPSRVNVLELRSVEGVGVLVGMADGRGNNRLSEVRDAVFLVGFTWPNTIWDGSGVGMSVGAGVKVGSGVALTDGTSQGYR